MPIPNLTNPFSGPSNPMGINDIAYRYPQSNLNTSTPSVPVTITIPISAGQVTSTLSTLNTIMGIQTSDTASSNFDAAQIAAIAATIVLFNTYIGGGTFTISIPELQNIVLATQAIFGLQHGGSAITLAEVNGSGSFLNQIFSDFPNGAYTATCCDTFGIVDTGENSPGIQISNPGDFTTWDPLQIVYLESQSDNVVAVDNVNGYVVFYGQRSLEWWEDAGTAPISFQRVDGAQQNYGLAARFSRVQYMNSIAFLGQNFEGAVQVLIFNGFQPQPISNPDIEHIINNFDVVNDAYAYSFIIDSHPIYRITFPSGGYTFDYDGATQMWNFAQSGTIGINRHLTSLGITFNYNNYASDYSSGNIYYLDPNNYTDNGYLMKKQWATRHTAEDGNEFTIDELVLDMATGLAPLSPNLGSDPQIILEISKDGGETYPQVIPMSLGLRGQYMFPRVNFTQLGTGRDWMFRFTVTDPVPVVISRAFFLTRDGTEKRA